MAKNRDSDDAEERFANLRGEAKVEIAEDEIFHVLKRIEEGAVTVVSKKPERSYCDHVEYAFSNGWKFIVYDDCGEWDYIESVVAADGRAATPWHYIDYEVPKSVTSKIKSPKKGGADAEYVEALEAFWRTLPGYVEYERLREYRPPGIQDRTIWRIGT